MGHPTAFPTILLQAGRPKPEGVFGRSPLPPWLRKDKTNIMFGLPLCIGIRMGQRIRRSAHLTSKEAGR